MSRQYTVVVAELPHLCGLMSSIKNEQIQARDLVTPRYTLIGTIALFLTFPERTFFCYDRHTQIAPVR